MKSKTIDSHGSADDVVGTIGEICGEATPTPWKVDEFPTPKQVKHGRNPHHITISTNFPEALCNGARSIAVMTGYGMKDAKMTAANKANAALIVSAVNQHAALKAVAEAVSNYLKMGQSTRGEDFEAHLRFALFCPT